jgi:carboxypeptidase Q
MIKRFTIALLTVATTFSAFAQEPVNTEAIQKIRKEGLDNSKVMEHAFQLTDVIGPRLANSPGIKKGREWAVKYLTEIGLKNVKQEYWGDFGKGWSVEKYYAATTTPFYRPIIGYPKAWTPGTNGPIKSEVILVKADTVTDLAAYKGKLAGKIVIIESVTYQPLKNSTTLDVVRHSDEKLEEMANAKPAEPRVGRPAGGRGGNNQMAMMMRMRQNRAAINEVLLEEKVGLILSKSSRGSYGTFFTSNGASYALDAKPVSPELEVAQEDFLHMLRLLRNGQKVEVEAEVKTTFYNDPKGYNVVAEIPGTDKKLKDEVVMIGGHFDSWHSGTGATDNAAGAAIMMEVMRILKAIDFAPKRTIRIALWDAEEQGLHGSRGYVKNHYGDRNTMKLLPAHSKLSAYYNLDNGGGAVRGIYLQENTAVKDIFQAWLNPFADLGAKTVTVGNTGGTDHLSYDALGLPGFQFIQDPMDYSSRTHHSNQDTYDRLVEDDLKKSATIIASFVYHTSERAEKIPRKELPKPAEPRN